MKSKILILIGILGVTTTLFATTNSEVIFDDKCAVCHIKTIPTDRTNMIAPALNGIMRHVKMSYPDREEAIKFMVDYVQNPSEQKAICMPQKIARFGVMPSQKGNITPDELKRVSAWMFDNYPTANFRGQGMMQGNKGNKGMGRSQNRPSFAMVDTNKDGKITPEEFDAFLGNSNRGKAMGQKRSPQKGMGRNRSTFPEFDLNKDGVITKQELLQVREEKQAQRAAQGMPMRNAANAPSFESIDTNGDGQIRPDEFDKRR